ncbi:arylamine N-acetyltransferase family protein [Kitasatospora fiedleri]|uniref:arylamine N-acetyltransferase family protein n=1 Tax=Kitasatospora fiedleri TaxID=2991545 RepID=UPI00249ADB9B|nr:arylamine N-acetyltransferase [Kitasatospora fiedleri]
MTVDLDKYFTRIAWDGDRAPTLATLRSLHRAHVLGIPFENLDVVIGEVPSLDLRDLQAKLVESARGGYCFEHNSLFAAVLERLGFAVRRLTGRVRAGARPWEERPRTHMVLAVEIPGVPGRYLADVGYGNTGALLEPLPMVPGQEHETAGRRHRLVLEEADGPAPIWVVQVRGSGGWQDQTAFTMDRVPVADLVLGNWFTATYPRSPFHRLYVQRTLATGHHLLLDGTTFVRTAPDGTRSVREIENPGDLRDLLHTEFGLTPPAGFRPPTRRA